jgi:hypothetical protein
MKETADLSAVLFIHDINYPAAYEGADWEWGSFS